MEAANCSLRVKRPLLDPRFEGYKLSLEPLPCYQLELDAGGIGGSLSHAVPFRVGCHRRDPLSLWLARRGGLSLDASCGAARLHLERPYPESGTHAGTRGYPFTPASEPRDRGPWLAPAAEPGGSPHPRPQLRWRLPFLPQAPFCKRVHQEATPPWKIPSSPFLLTQNHFFGEFFPPHLVSSFKYPGPGTHITTLEVIKGKRFSALSTAYCCY